mmetsp:Transcript_6306/g.18738  ORF Transcript_6306/g.18738 Transcript_6306/m.18738 type:complete len:610 (+) Transcript_6306:2321-4150(+)
MVCDVPHGSRLEFAAEGLHGIVARFNHVEGGLLLRRSLQLRICHRGFFCPPVHDLRGALHAAVRRFELLLQSVCLHREPLVPRLLPVQHDSHALGLGEENFFQCRHGSLLLDHVTGVLFLEPRQLPLQVLHFPSLARPLFRDQGLHASQEELAQEVEFAQAFLVGRVVLHKTLDPLLKLRVLGFLNEVFHPRFRVLQAIEARDLCLQVPSGFVALEVFLELAHQLVPVGRSQPRAARAHFVKHDHGLPKHVLVVAPHGDLTGSHLRALQPLPVHLDRATDRFLALHFGDALPRRGDGRHRTVVDGLDVELDQAGEHGPVEAPVPEPLRPDLVEYLLVKALDPVPELLPQLGRLEGVQLSKALLAGVGPHHGEAVPLREQAFDGLPDAVPLLLLDGVRARGRVQGRGAQGFLQVLLRGAVLEVQEKVSKQPDQRRHLVARVPLLCHVPAGAPDEPGELADQRKLVDGALVDRSHAVVHEDGGQEDGHGEYLRGIVRRLVVAVDPLRVHQEHAELPAVLGPGQGLRPQVQPLGARLGRPRGPEPPKRLVLSHLEHLPQQVVQQKALALPRPPAATYHGNVPLGVTNNVQSLRVHHEPPFAQLHQLQGLQSC